MALKHRRSLDTLEIDKWISTAEFLINRKDGRDLLCYEIMLRALLEIKQQRRIFSALQDLISSMASRAILFSPQSLRQALKRLFADAEKNAKQVVSPTYVEPEWDVPQLEELRRAQVVRKINETLKRQGFVLVLHYNPNDPQQAKPIAATFERWQGST